MNKLITNFLALGIGGVGDMQTVATPLGGGGPISGTTITGDTFKINNANPDVWLTRQSAGVLQVGNNAADASGSVAATSFIVGGSSTLVLDSANTLAQKNGTNAQTFNVYGTTTGPKLARMLHDGTNGQFMVNSGQVRYGTDTNSVVQFNSNGTVALSMTSTSLACGSGTGTVTLGTPSNGFQKLYIDFTNTGTVGAVTINKSAGRVNIAAAGTSVVVTNSFVTAASKVFCVIATADATATIKNVVPAAGSFTITIVAATAQTAIDFFVVNAD